MKEKEIVSSISALLSKLDFYISETEEKENQVTHTFYNELIQQSVRIIFVESGNDKNMYFEYILFPGSPNKSGFIFTLFNISDKAFKRQLNLFQKHFVGIISSFIKIKKAEIS